MVPEDDVVPGLGVTIVTTDEVPTVTGVTDLNFTVPGRVLNLVGFNRCLAASWLVVFPS